MIGGSGSGKTRFWLKPNLMQMHSSYVVTDPKGTILVECGKMLQRGTPKLGKDGKPMKDKRGKVIYEPYRIKVLNTINFKKSMHYNPFAYIHSEKDILKLVTTLIANTKGEGKAGDDFWVKAETLLYCALIGYIHYEAPVEEQNFSTLIEFINAMEVREDDEEFKNPVDMMFDALEAEKPNHFAVRQYKKYKLAAGKTAKSILISCGARLAVFDIAELREVTSYDELELDTLGDQRTALFLIMSDTDDSFNFLISMCYTQLFNLLCEKADDVYGGRLPVHVRCLIDECANIGQIPKLEKLVATIRSREISACLVLQAQSQLKAIYKDNADTIIGNMDTSIFLGGKEPTTLKELAAVLGKETIDTYNTGENRGRETSHSLNYQKLGKELMNLQIPAVTAEPEDYTGEDGLLYCGKCRTPKEAYFPADKATLFGRDRHPAECDCQRAQRMEREAAEQQRKHRDKVEELKRRGFTDPAMREWTFANDNGRNPQMKTAHFYVEHWEDMKAGNIGYLLWGSVGTGKSYLAGCIANALMEKEISVRMTNFALILNDLAATFEGKNEYISNLCRYPLLILDDFGMERGTEYGLEQVYNVIDSRYRSGKPLIVTTNLTLTELQNPQDTPHARIYDRLLEMCAPVCFSGENFRRESAQNKLNRLKQLMND